jgi:aspartate-semialdehyde dehydrogenase
MSTTVGIVGATGAVGQRFVQLIDDHPDFEITAVAASPESAGKSYHEAAKWRVDTPIPEDVATLTIREASADALPDDLDLVFSSLPSSIAEEVEPDLCEAGYTVSSNSSNERLADDVPLVVPELNAGHLDLLEIQRDRRGWDGALVKNPNCSTITMVPTLAALRGFGLNRVHVSTLQAVSGAGYSGVTSMEILDNVLPHIGGEEDKMETETRKLLGEFDGAGIDWHDLTVSASCNRVATLDGHLENIWADLSASVTTKEATDAMESVASLDLPSSPDQLITVFEDPNRPQPRLDRMIGNGMGIAAGGLQETRDGIQYDCLAHNTIRGAAGASLLNGELLCEDGWA